jgi:hypothetical protein
MRPPGEDSLVSVKEASQKDWDVDLLTLILRHVHWLTTKHLFRYLRGTSGYGLRYASDGDMKLQSYTDSDWAGSAVDQKSTSGCCFSMGSL